MPPIVYGEHTSRDQKFPMIDASYEYDYPDGLDLEPGSDLHRALVDKILRRATESQRVMSARYPVWREIDNSLRMFVRPDWKPVVGDTARPTNPTRHRTRQEEETRRTLPAVVMPTSYAALETLLSYMTAVFTQPPIIPFDGVGPDDVYGALLLQELIQQQSHRNKLLLSLHTQCRDAFAYGFGVLHPVWKRQMGWWTENRPVGYDSILEGEFIETGTVKERVFGLLREGGAAENIDPWKYFPDPNVPIHDPQSGEYVSWVSRTNYNQLLMREMDEDEGLIFNCKYVRHTDGRSSLVETRSQRINSPTHRARHIGTGDPVDVLWMYITIIPKEWNVGSGKRPEKWLFGLAADSVIVCATQADFDHGEFAAVVAAPDYDGYSSTPVSRLEVITDWQKYIDFLYTSHVHNVRKVLNDMIVVDPDMVNYYDLLEPGPGKLIRMRPSQFGRGTIDQAIRQLPIQDVTQNNVQEALMMHGQMMETIGVGENARGQLNHRGPRISATQASGARASALGFMERVATLIDIQSMGPLGYQLACNVQQFMEEETWVKIYGETARRMQEELGVEVTHGKLKVSPGDLIVDHDVIVNQRLLPNSQDPGVWTQLLQIALQSQHPDVIQRLDVMKIIKHIARQQGAKNFSDFEKAAGLLPVPQVMDDGMVQEQVRQGNLAPMEEVGGDGQAGATPAY